MIICIEPIQIIHHPNIPNIYLNDIELNIMKIIHVDLHLRLCQCHHLLMSPHQ